MTQKSPRGEISPDGRVVLPFKAARWTGLLWAINKVLMHPRGFALAFEFPEGATREQIEAHQVDPIGWSIMGDGTEPWQFTDGLDDIGFDAFEDLLEWARRLSQERGESLEDPSVAGEGRS